MLGNPGYCSARNAGALRGCPAYSSEGGILKKFVLAVSAAALTLVTVAGAAVAQQPAERGHFFVGFATAPGSAERALVQRHGGTVRFAFPEVNALAVDLPRASIADFARTVGVRYVEQDPERHALASQLVPASSNGLWGLVATTAVQAQAAGYRGAGVKACVADTGIDANHVDIAANYNGGFDAIDNDNDPNEGNNMWETHGTHVAGTVLGVDNQAGILGVAPDASLYHARVLADKEHDGTANGTTSQVMAGVRWLAQEAGCKVVNMSLGGGLRSRTEENLYKSLYERGTLIVAAAGNDAARTISYPAGYPVVLSVSAVDRNDRLADFSNQGHGLDLSAPGVDVLSSYPDGTGRNASVEAAGTLSALAMEFAGTTHPAGVSGALVDCGLGTAPCTAAAGRVALIQRGSITFGEKVANAMAGGAIAAIVYNNAAGNFSGTLSTETSPSGSTWIPAVSVSDTDGAALKSQVGQTVTVYNLPTDWETISGTSMATPHVSGVAALVFGANPSLTPAGVEQILKATARDIGPAGYDTQYGYGMPNALAAVNAATP
jgi:subtilisin family serine protease